MKTTLKVFLVIAFFALCSNVPVSNNKLAHISLEELIMSMPEYDSAMVQFQKFAQDLESAFESMTVERNRKFEEYSRNQANWTDLVRRAKEDELNSMNQRIQAFQEQAQEDMQQEQGKLMQPVYEKANKAIEDVAKEQGVTYVFASQAILFKATSTLDLLPAVKKYLGIN